MGATSSVLTMKHLLSDLWRTFDFQRRWEWDDQGRTKGHGNATRASRWIRTVTPSCPLDALEKCLPGVRLSTESDNLAVKVRRYNVQHGFSKNVAQTLEAVDILAAKVTFYKCACTPTLIRMPPRRYHGLSDASPSDASPGAHLPLAPPGGRGLHFPSLPLSTPLPLPRVPGR